MLLNQKDHGIVEGVLRLASAIRRPVVAEGVESVELGFLLALSGCKYAQGYGIAKPMPEEDVLEWLNLWASADNNQWRGLGDLVDAPGEDNDLSAALFSWRLWMARLDQAEPSLVGFESLPEIARPLAFEEWSRGVGAAHYGQLPQWERLTHLQKLNREELDGQHENLMDDENGQLLDRLRKRSQEIEGLLIDMGNEFSPDFKP